MFTKRILPLIQSSPYSHFGGLVAECIKDAGSSAATFKFEDIIEDWAITFEFNDVHD